VNQIKTFKNSIQIAVLGVICAISFFWHLNAFEVHLMEARNFTAAREIVANNSWLIPTMNGEIRITKPPLPTWLTALARMAGGNRDDNVVMRLPAAMMSVLLVISLWGTLKTISDDPLLPFLTAAVFATSLLVIKMGRRGTWDIYCHAFIMTAIWALSAGWEKENRAYGLFVWAGVASGLSFLSKGPVSPYTLLLPFLAGYLVGLGPGKVKRKWKEALIAMVVFVFIALPWPLYIYMKFPEMAASITHAETSSWTSRYVEPIYFYLQFPVFTGIWTVPLIISLLPPLAIRKFKHSTFFRFALTWMIVSIVLLSVIPEKKERYLLPAMIPSALLVAYTFTRWVQAQKEKRSTKEVFWGITLHTGVVGLTALALPVLIWTRGLNRQIFTPGTAVGFSLVFLATAWVIIGVWKKRTVMGLFAGSIVLVCLINLTMLPVLAPLFRKNPEFQSLRFVRDREELKDLAFYHTLTDIRMTLVWDIGKEVHAWDCQNDPLPLEKLPVAVFSHQPLRAVINKDYLRRVKIEPIGQYKYHPHRSGRVMHLSILKSRQ